MSQQNTPNSTPNPNRDDLPAAFQKAWFDYPLSTDDPLGFDHYEQLVDEINTAETESAKRLRALLPKPCAGDVITLKMGITVKVIPTFDNSLVGRVIEDVSGLYRPNTKIEFELSEVA